jgi:hypothetical protein
MMTVHTHGGAVGKWRIWQVNISYPRVLDLWGFFFDRLLCPGHAFLNAYFPDSSDILTRPIRRQITEPYLSITGETIARQPLDQP